jgi:hypothetical protein
VDAEHESGLLLGGCFSWPHVFPFRAEDRSAWLLLSGLW